MGLESRLLDQQAFRRMDDTGQDLLQFGTEDPRTIGPGTSNPTSGKAKDELKQGC